MPACVEGFTKHRYDGGDVCVREGCGVTKDGASSELPTLPGESLDDIRTSVQEPQVKPSKTERKKAVQESEAQLKAVLNRSNARTIVRTVEGAKPILASRLLDYHGHAFTLEQQEEAELVEQLTQYLQVSGISIDSPKGCLVMLMLTELRITARQFSQASLEMEAKASK